MLMEKHLSFDRENETSLEEARRRAVPLAVFMLRAGVALREALGSEHSFSTNDTKMQNFVRMACCLSDDRLPCNLVFENFGISV